MFCFRKKMFLYGLKCFNIVCDVYVKLIFDRYLGVIYWKVFFIYRRVFFIDMWFINVVNLEIE